MQRFLFSLLGLWLISITAILPAYGADSTSFDPTTVQVKAKGSGGVPVGTIVAWPVAKNPSDMSNWLECNGQSITQSAFPELFAVVGAKVPDLRGYFLRGLGGNSAALGVSQGDAIRNITGGYCSDYNGGSNSQITWGVNGAFKRNTLEIYHGVAYYWTNDNRDAYPKIEFDASRVVPTANENRPLNKSVRYFIRARP